MRSLPSSSSGLTTRAARRSHWESHRVPDTACRATNSRRSTRSSDATRTHRARRKKRSARLSTCEQISDLFLSRSTLLKKIVFCCMLDVFFVFVYAGISRRSLYGFRTSVRWWRAPGNSRYLRVQVRMLLPPPVLQPWTCSHLHRQK